MYTHCVYHNVYTLATQSLILGSLLRLKRPQDKLLQHHFKLDKSCQEGPAKALFYILHIIDVNQKFFNFRFTNVKHYRFQIIYVTIYNTKRNRYRL